MSDQELEEWSQEGTLLFFGPRECELTFGDPQAIVFSGSEQKRI